MISGGANASVLLAAARTGFFISYSRNDKKLMPRRFACVNQPDRLETGRRRCAGVPAAPVILGMVSEAARSSRLINRPAVS
jgi:hypothetical protein